MLNNPSDTPTACHLPLHRGGLYLGEVPTSKGSCRKTQKRKAPMWGSTAWLPRELSPKRSDA